MARLYYQIYWDDAERMRFSPEQLASIVRAVAGEMERLEVQHHQLRIMLDGDVEVKVGFDPFIQVSSPSPEKTTEIWEKLRPIIEREGGGEQ